MALSDGSPVPPSDKDAIVSAPDGPGKTVLTTINQYPGPSGRGWHGALVEETTAFRSDIDLFYDLHVLLWDADLEQTLDVRNDAVASEVSYESARVPEAHVANRFEFATGYPADLHQDVLVTVEAPALLVRNAVTFERPNEHTLYTLAGLGIDGGRTEEFADEASVRHAPEYDAVVAHDGDRYLALLQYRPATGKTRFDGHRIGVQGRTRGPDRSAWEDIYGEDDGWIDDDGYNRGRIDVGVGLHAGRDAEVTWLTAVGFGRDEESAIGAARRALDRGYAAERESFANAWRDWHGTVSGGPTGDAAADRLYELSLTSMKCAQDPSGAVIAGAFTPQDEEYKYVWPRDLTIIVQALLAADATEEARAALAWLDAAQIKSATRDARDIDRRGTWWQNYYVDRTPHWRALQLDQVGGPVYAHWLVWRETGDDAALDAHYEMSRLAAEFLLDYGDGDLPGKHQDPWEEVWGHSTEGTAAAIAGLRAAAELAAARGDADFAATCRARAETWAENFDRYCFETGTAFGDHYVTAHDPEYPDSPRADRRPDAAAFMACWPWNVRPATSEEMRSTARLAEERPWRATNTPCLGRYPGDDYTPSGSAEDGGWPLCEAYADVVRWLGDVDADAVAEHLFEHADRWTTAAGLLPERVDGNGDVRWNSNLQWSQAAYVLLAESHVRGNPFGMAPPGRDRESASARSAGQSTAPEK
jgi:GH15 family glucan-1,4-alpha-glucosidase